MPFLLTKNISDSVVGSLTLRTQVGLLAKNHLLLKRQIVSLFQDFLTVIKVTILTDYYVLSEQSKYILKVLSLSEVTELDFSFHQREIMT